MSSPTFTCITCRVAFADADLQRSHYKTDWHRYNLKRKVANLPHVTAEGFNQRVLAQRAQVATEQNKVTKFYCEPCGKKLSSEAAYNNHLSSAKHKACVVKREQRISESEGTPQVSEEKAVKSDTSKKQLGTNGNDKMDTGSDGEEEMEEWDEDVLGIEECLFCSKISKSVEASVKHMTADHSFFIPDIEYLVDLEGFITYLGEKVGSGKMCLWCNDRSKIFHSVKATQQHMIDKGHCMLYHDGDAAYEYADFYDYSSSYPEGQSGNPDDEVKSNVMEVNDEEYEMTLPSGAKVGHRALSKFYKQNLVSRINPEGRSMVHKVMSHYKALGWTGATGVVAQKRVKDLQYMQRQKHKHWEKLGVKSNKTSQMHFRPQVVF